MVRQVTDIDAADLVIYPETDGEPMAQNTLQFIWIVHFHKQFTKDIKKFATTCFPLLLT